MDRELLKPALIALSFLGVALALALLRPERTAAERLPPPAQEERASAGASQPAPEKKDGFELLDLDGDGKVSLAEAAGHGELVRRFDRADRNRDGRLSRAEYDAIGKAKKTARSAK